MKKRREETREPATSGLSRTDTFVKTISDLLKQGLTAESYDETLKNVTALCEDNYDLTRAGAAAMKVAEKQPYRSESFNLYCKVAGDLYRVQCETERYSGRTTIFTGFYNAAMDAYLDGGWIREAAGVAFEHSHWLIRNALYRNEPGKERYLELSVKAFDDVVKRSEGELAAFIHEQWEGRRKAADALLDIQPPAHLTAIKDPELLRARVQRYQNLITILTEICNTYDIAAYLSEELVSALAPVLPDEIHQYAGLALKLRQRHEALLREHGIPL